MYVCVCMCVSDRQKDSSRPPTGNNHQIIRHWESEKECTPGINGLGCLSSIDLLIMAREGKKQSTQMGKSVYSIRTVTYLVNDGFLKPSLIYWLSVCAL